MKNGNGELMFGKNKLNFITLCDELRAYTFEKDHYYSRMQISSIVLIG